MIARLLRVSLALSTAIALPQIAQAQEGDAPADAGNQIVVTAQFRETNIQDTPLAITAVTGETMAARGMTDVQSIASTAPSVTLTPGPAAFGKTIVSYIRGVGANDYSPAFDPSVGYYIDDIYYASLAGTTFDLMDLERVEVLRGPQGTLFGKNTVGGAIRLISKKPDDVLGGSMEATYGSFDRFEVRGSLNIPLVGDTLAMRVSGIHKERRGYVKRLDFACANPGLAGAIPSDPAAGANCITGYEGGENIDAFRVAIRAAASDRVEINLSGDYTNDRSDPGALSLVLTGPDTLLDPFNATQTIPAFGVPYDDRFITGDPYVTYSSFANPLTGNRDEPLNRVEAYGFAGTIDIELADSLRLRSITGYRNLKTSYAFDGDGSPLPLVQQTDSIAYEQFSQEFQLLGELMDERLEWVLGAYYFKGEATSQSYADLPIAGILAEGDDTFEVEDYSAFGHLTFHVTDRLNIIGGLRYTRETKNFHLFHPLSIYLPGGATLPTPPLDFVAEPLEYERWNPKVSIDYAVTPDVMVYAQFSTGFRGGGFNNRPFTAAQVFPVGPESLKAYEVGFKSQLFDRALTLNLTAFQSDYSEIQQTVAGLDSFGVPFAAPLNVGKARIRGLELDSALHLGGFSLNVVANYLDAKITEATPPTGLSVPPSALPQVGSRLAFAPEFKLNVGAQYELDLAKLGSLTPRFDVMHQSEIRYDSTGLPAAVEPGYTIANARLTWANEGGDLSVALGVTNVFDKYYNAYIFNTYAQNLGALSVSPSRPREWSVTARKTF